MVVDVRRIAAALRRSRLPRRGDVQLRRGSCRGPRAPTNEASRRLGRRPAHGRTSRSRPLGTRRVAVRAGGYGHRWSVGTLGPADGRSVMPARDLPVVRDRMLGSRQACVLPRGTSGRPSCRRVFPSAPRMPRVGGRCGQQRPLCRTLGSPAGYPVGARKEIAPERGHSAPRFPMRTASARPRRVGRCEQAGRAARRSDRRV